jgi:signal transduction histidine kinase
VTFWTSPVSSPGIVADAGAHPLAGVGAVGVSDLRRPGAEKNLQWRVELDPQSDCDVLIDPTRFKQVLSNLLSNAIKFTLKARSV